MDDFLSEDEWEYIITSTHYKQMPGKFILAAQVTTVDGKVITLDTNNFDDFIKMFPHNKILEVKIGINVHKIKTQSMENTDEILKKIFPNEETEIQPRKRGRLKFKKKD